jgi:hypothetical protein
MSHLILSKQELQKLMGVNNPSNEVIVNAIYDTIVNNGYEIIKKDNIVEDKKISDDVQIVLSSMYNTFISDSARLMFAQSIANNKIENVFDKVLPYLNDNAKLLFEYKIGNIEKVEDLGLAESTQLHVCFLGVSSDSFLEESIESFNLLKNRCQALAKKINEAADKVLIEKGYYIKPFKLNLINGKYMLLCFMASRIPNSVLIANNDNKDFNKLTYFKSLDIRKIGATTHLVKKELNNDSTTNSSC